MKTVVYFYDYKGNFKNRKLSKYKNYKEEDIVLFMRKKHRISSIIINEDENEQQVRAFCKTP